VLPFNPNDTPLEFENTICVTSLLVVPALTLIFAAPGAATLNDRFNPALFCVIEPEIFAPLNVVPVPAYPAAFKLMPDELTVHVTFVWAVFSPTYAVLTLAAIALPADVTNDTPFAFENCAVWNVKLPFAADNAWFDWLVSALCDAVIALPADVPNEMPLRFEKEIVWKANEPFAALAAWFDCDVSAANPLNDSAIPFEFCVIEPLMFVPPKVVPVPA